MAILDDLAVEIAKYPEQKVDITFIDFVVIGGGSLTPGKKFKFKVKITNRGHLEMKNVFINIIPEKRLSLPSSTYINISFTENGAYTLHELIYPNDSSGFNVHGEDVDPLINTFISNWLYGQAMVDLTIGELLIARAKIRTWNASFDHLLNDHSIGGKKEGLLVLPQPNN